MGSLLASGVALGGAQSWEVHRDPLGYRIEWWNGEDHVESQFPLPSPETVIVRLLAGGFLA